MEHIFDPIPNIFLQLGPITWYKYSLMILIGIIVAAVLGIKEGKITYKAQDSDYIRLGEFNEETDVIEKCIMNITSYYILVRWTVHQ